MEEFSLNKRIDLLIKHLGVSQNAFAKSLDTSSSRISNIITLRNKPDSELLAKIAEVYTNVSADWLLTGKGEMLLMEEKPQKKIEYQYPDLYQENINLKNNIMQLQEQVIQYQRQEMSRLKNIEKPLQ